MELNITDEIREGFESVLRHCALEGAVRVTYSFNRTEGGSKASLKYYDADDRPIGDDRDYDILKSCFNRLGSLAERLVEEDPADMDKSLREPALELIIDLDLVSGHMTVSG